MRIVPIIKPVGVACNLKCRYCWFNPLNQSQAAPMSLALLEKIVHDYAEADSTGSYQFIWHGGEPLMAGRDFYEGAIKFQKRYMSAFPVKNAIQTNATILTSQWTEFFLRNGFKVGVSLDGPKALHDANRVTLRGAGTHDRIMANVVSARKQGLRFSVIATINKANVSSPEEIFRFFVDNGITSFGFNMVFERSENGSPTLLSISNEEYAAFQNRIFDLWLAEDSSRIRVRHIDSIVGGMLGLPVKSCIYAGTCQRFISINSNGDVYPCERLTAAPRLGNLNESSLPEIVGARRYRRHVRRTTTLPAECRSCKYLTICRNGCTHHRVEGRLFFCEGRKAVFQHMEVAVSRIIRTTSDQELVSRSA